MSRTWGAILHDDTSEPLYFRLAMAAALSPWDNKYYCRLRSGTANAICRISIWWGPSVWPSDSPADANRYRYRYGLMYMFRRAMKKCFERASNQSVGKLNFHNIWYFFPLARSLSRSRHARHLKSRKKRIYLQVAVRIRIAVRKINGVIVMTKFDVEC